MNFKGKFSGFDTAVVDWGIGGLSVYNEIKRRDPKRRILYFSDSGNAPYATMTPEALTDRILEIILHFHANGLSRIVVACNAASTALPALQHHFDRLKIEVTGVIQHGVDLVRSGPFRNIGVIGGKRTILSRSYVRPLETSRRKITGRIVQPLSEMIENGELETPEMHRLLHTLLAPLKGCDAVVLACTHYPAVRTQIQRVLGECELVDPAAATAEFVTENWRPIRGDAGSDDAFFTTGEAVRMKKAVRLAFGKRIDRIGTDLLSL